MVYKILFLESLVIAGMFYLRFSPDNAIHVSQQVEFATTTPAEEPVSPAIAPIPSPTIEEMDAPDLELVFPVKGFGTDAVISVFGDKRGKSRLHKGIDIKAPRGTAVVASIDGFIERIKEGGSGGKQLYLRDGEGKLYYYAHLDSWSVDEFAAVKAGDIIGTVGDTGNASGTTPHLHFEILLGKKKKAIDPLAVVRWQTTGS